MNALEGRFAGAVCVVSGAARGIGFAVAMDGVERACGAPVGVLVNNAVWARFGPLSSIDEDVSRRTLAVGLEAAIWTVQAAVPQMQRRGRGSVVNGASVAAQHPQRTQSPMPR